jgi:hypothetical protein
LAVNTTSYNHTGLTCGTTYSYSLKATNSTGDSSAITATASTIACPATIPTAPSSLVATAISATQINLTWVDNSGNETGFKLESPAGTALSTLAANTTSYNHTGLTCGTTYSYSLKATNSTGDSSAITATASTIACPVVIPNYNLGIISAGTGTGIVSGTPAGTYPSGTSIILSALANTGSSFTGWSPSLCGSAFNLTANLNCTAVFDAVPVSPNNYSLTLNKTGTGTGVISGTTAGTYAANTAINLTAVANTGSRFMGWSPSNCASFSLTQNTTCTAIFDSNASATLYNISLKTLGNGAGIVGGTPAGKYAQNTAVNLLAVADSSSEFAGWTPSSCASTFQLTADSTCVATFNLKTVQNFNLALNKTGTGTGTILGTATGVYPKNTRVNLVAVADNGSEFTAWNPSSCGKSFDLLADTYCTAVFDKKPTHIIKPMYNLTLLSSGVSNANLTATPAAPYAAGTQVKLSATAPNAEFLGWQGNGCDSNLTIDRDLICVANFQVLSTGSVRVVDETGNALAQLSEKKSASSIKVRVVRVGNNKGAISVHYQTQAGTALTGIDYQTVSGTLTWANLDNSVKVIEIPVVQNSTHYGDNYLYLLLNSDNPLLELDSHFVKLILQDVLVHSPCNNALQLGANGKLQGNAGCFTHRVNEVELEKASVLPNTPLHIQTLIDTNPQYLGQYAEVLLVAVYFPDPIADPIALQRRGNTWLSWGGALDELSAITRYPSLPKQITVDVFQGTLGNALGRFEVYIGYRLADGSIVFNGLNILEVNVSMP